MSVPTQLIETAVAAQNMSYSPYSHYAVGAAVVTTDGQIYSGTNIENASYGGTICAERVAVFEAVKNGQQKLQALAVIGGSPSNPEHFAAPCGLCRQVLREFADPSQFIVYLINNSELTDIKKYTLEELLPQSFGPDNLEL